MRIHLNPRARLNPAFTGLFTDEEYRDVHAYYAAHPEWVQSPLVALPGLARDAGVRAVTVKDESRREPVHAFKIMGVRYAVHRLGDAAAARGLVCATAGNHGRAVARVAHEKAVPCTVFVPAARRQSDGAHALELQVRAARVGGMRSDGATVVEVDGSYEEAVRRAADHAARTGATIVSDTAWEGYDRIPRWIMAGYTQVFEEAYGEWDARPDVMLVQGGVGGLVCAAVSWAAWRFGHERPQVVACEPDGAACLLESAAAGHPVALTPPLDTIMAGLRCAEPSSAAWPAIAEGVDGFVSIADAAVLETVTRLGDGDPPIDAGPSGACGLAALVALMQAPEAAGARGRLGLDRSTRVFAVVTEGP